MPLFVAGLLAINQVLADAPDELTESFWQKIEANALPEGYEGATHQEFVDAQMAKMEGARGARVGQLWKEREKSGPPMTNRGAFFVKIMMYVAEGEKLKLPDRQVDSGAKCGADCQHRAGESIVGLRRSNKGVTGSIRWMLTNDDPKRTHLNQLRSIHA